MGVVLPKKINRIDHHHFGNLFYLYFKQVHFFWKYNPGQVVAEVFGLLISKTVKSYKKIVT